VPARRPPLRHHRMKGDSSTCNVLKRVLRHPRGSLREARIEDKVAMLLERAGADGQPVVGSRGAGALPVTGRARETRTLTPGWPEADFKDSPLRFPMSAAGCESRHVAAAVGLTVHRNSPVVARAGVKNGVRLSQIVTLSYGAARVPRSRWAVFGFQRRAVG
jgi:hypothetical protein